MEHGIVSKSLLLQIARQPSEKKMAEALVRIGDYVADLHRRNGINLRTGVSVTAIEDQGSELHIVMTDGERIAAD